MIHTGSKSFKYLIAVLLFAAPFNLVIAESASIAIIIDDIGNNLHSGKRVINSQLPITCSILPARPHSIKLARLAHQQGKEVMLHLPMQASKSERLGYGALTANMSQHELTRIVDISLDAVPHVRGINNHMGSLLTSDVSYMEWLMQAIANRDENLFFIDSRTSAQTVAASTARTYHIPNLQRDVFLDDTAHDATFVKQQVKRLVKIAKQKGYALAIGHPYKTTLKVLEQEFANTELQGVQLVSVSKLITIAADQERTKESYSIWQKSASLAY